MTTVVISYGPPLEGNGTWGWNDGTSLAGGTLSDFLADPRWFQTITFEGLSVSPGESFIYSGLDHDRINAAGLGEGGAGTYMTTVVRASFSNRKSAKGTFPSNDTQMAQTVLLTEVGP